MVTYKEMDMRTLNILFEKRGYDILTYSTGDYLIELEVKRRKDKGYLFSLPIELIGFVYSFSVNRDGIVKLFVNKDINKWKI